MLNKSYLSYKVFWSPQLLFHYHILPKINEIALQSIWTKNRYFI